ncbi:serine/threonine protein phosphatase [Pseudomonas sp. ALS1279]|nr:metallophosphoesterase [Pseudomonas sp. ALS1279]TRO26998.1 serine/threonine protein phosphatase [Pseudomonas sp. ALS1279]
MRILIYSDLHLEFGVDFQPPSIDVDLVILAGDISKGSRGIRWANQAFTCDVVFVAGNHEYYSGHLNRTMQKMKDAADEYVHVLENESFICHGVRFLGATAWTDFSISGDPQTAAREALAQMNDYKRIRVGESYRKLRPSDVIERNHSSHEWLKSELAKDFDGKTIVITHHAPLPEVIGDEHEGHLSAAYANNWPQLVTQADVWGFGHTHLAVDTNILGCRLISNPRGYPGEQTGFDPGLVIEL